jgi:beta-mannanase
LVYTQLIIQEIKEKTKIYALTTSGSPTQASSTSGDCMANYSSNGKLHIPCVTAPNKSGGTSVYDITMQKQSSGFVFNVDMNSIKPR